jgi:hypothetical protein
MALDSKNKRGSAMLLTIPFRQWLAEPDGTLAVEDRMSLLKLAATFAAVVTYVRSHRYSLRVRRRIYVVVE